MDRLGGAAGNQVQFDRFRAHADFPGVQRQFLLHLLIHPGLVLNFISQPSDGTGSQPHPGHIRQQDRRAQDGHSRQRDPGGIPADTFPGKELLLRFCFLHDTETAAGAHSQAVCPVLRIRKRPHGIRTAHTRAVHAVDLLTVIEAPVNFPADPAGCSPQRASGTDRHFHHRRFLRFHVFWTGF